MIFLLSCPWPSPVLSLNDWIVMFVGHRLVLAVPLSPFRRSRRDGSQTSSDDETESDFDNQNYSNRYQRNSRKWVNPGRSKSSHRWVLHCRSRMMRSETSESEEMNETLDILLLPNFKKHRYKINYMSNRELLRLYAANIFLFPFSFYSSPNLIKPR